MERVYGETVEAVPRPGVRVVLSCRLHRRPAIRSLDDPALKTLRVGVHLLGDDYENPPPVHELAKRGIVQNVVGFNTFYSAENPPSAIVDAVASGKIDIAIVWARWPATSRRASESRPR